MKKLFTVVLPVYNGEKFIQDTLDSIFAQTYKNYELIVVDGQSTDATPQILSANKGKIDLIISESDSGMYDALNKGFTKAKGDYFCYINADDRLLPHTLEKVQDKFAEGKYDLVFGDVNFISAEGTVIYSYKAMNLSRTAIRYIRRPPFCQQSAFWTREIFFEKGGFDSSLKYVADSKFLLEVCLDPLTKKVRIPTVLGEYRMHLTSFSVGSTEPMINEGREMMKGLPLKENIFLNFLYETPIKVLNFRQILKKEFYEGPKIN